MFHNALIPATRYYITTGPMHVAWLGRSDFIGLP